MIDEELEIKAKIFMFMYNVSLVSLSVDKDALFNEFPDNWSDHKKQSYLTDMINEGLLCTYDSGGYHINVKGLAYLLGLSYESYSNLNEGYNNHFVSDLKRRIIADLDAEWERLNMSVNPTTSSVGFVSKYTPLGLGATIIATVDRHVCD